MYTPTLEVKEFTEVIKIRELPLPGRVLVSIGDLVDSSTPVLSAELPGDLSIIRVADRLGFEAEDVLEGMQVGVGDELKVGDLLCECRSFFGLFRSTLKSPVAGQVEFFTPANAHLGVRLASKAIEVLAYIQGEIAEIEPGKSVSIKTSGTFIQGIFGVGGEREGEILALEVSADSSVTEQTILSLGDIAGKILVGGSHFTVDALKAAEAGRVSGVVTGSIDSKTLRALAGKEIGVSITGDEDLPFSLFITEGFGALPISSRVMSLAKKVTGMRASMSGQTQVRAGALRPELIVPQPNLKSAVNQQLAKGENLVPGASIRIIRVPYFGALGTVVELPHEPQQIESGAVVRVLLAKLETDEIVVVPRANVELI